MTESNAAAVNARPDRTGSPRVSIHPGILSGTPCVDGTRIPVYMIADVVWTHGVDEARELWDLTRPQVIVACWYAGAYGTVHLWAVPDDDTDPPVSSGYRQDPVEDVWLERWRSRAFEASTALWSARYDDVSDPPGEHAEAR